MRFSVVLKRMQRLLQQLETASAQVLDDAGMHLARLQGGCPLVPQEVGPNDLPAEAGFEADVLSFTKGCFIGQEVVVRMHNLGRARRMLCLVHMIGEMPKIEADIVNEAGAYSDSYGLSIHVQMGGLALR